MEKKNRKTGFTIIELVVAVAIITVLAAIILVNVTSSINKGKDAAIEGNLSSLTTRGTAYFDASGSYDLFCAAPSGGGPIQTAIEVAKLDGPGTFTCYCNGINSPVHCLPNSGNTKWCACAPLKASANTFCVDYSGYKKETATACSIRCSAGACGD